MTIRRISPATQSMMVYVLLAAFFVAFFSLAGIAIYNGSKWQNLAKDRATAFALVAAKAQDPDDASRLVFVSARLSECLAKSRADIKEGGSKWHVMGDQEMSTAMDVEQKRCLNVLRGELLSLDPDNRRTVELIDATRLGT